MNNCRQVQDVLLTDYVDAQPGADDRAGIDRHLADCAACRAVLESVRQTEGRLRAAPSLTPPDHLWAGIRARIDPPPVQAPERLYPETSFWEFWFNNFFGAPQRTAWAALVTLVFIAGVVSLIAGPRNSGISAGTGASLVAMMEDRDPANASDDIDLNTNTEYLLHYQGEAI